MIQITYKLKKGRRSLVAVVGRGNSRFELGTGVALPDKSTFESPRNIVGGNVSERNACFSELLLWETGIRNKLESTVGTEIKELLKKTPNKVIFHNSLSSWLKQLCSQVASGVVVNEKTGNLLSPKTIIGMSDYTDLISLYIEAYGDFDFGTYNSSTYSSLTKQVVVNKYKSLGSTLKKFLLNDKGHGLETTFRNMARTKGFIKAMARDNNIDINQDLLSAFNFPKPNKNNEEDIIALDVDQYEWIINNESILRKDATIEQYRMIDYLVVGLITCARKGDMNTWTEANLRRTAAGLSLRYIPNKTKSSSAVTVDLTPVPSMVEEIFMRNIKIHGKLMPPLASGTRVTMRRLLKKHEIFNRDITVRSPKGEFIVKKTYDALKLHSLRSSGITYLLIKGVPEMIVKKISGHTTGSESFGLYAKIIESNKTDVMRSVYSMFETKKEPALV